MYVLSIPHSIITSLVFLSRIVRDSVYYIMSSDILQIIVLISDHILYFNSISYNMKILTQVHSTCVTYTMYKGSDDKLLF